jgi:hypothetical protein
MVDDVVDDATKLGKNPADQVLDKTITKEGIYEFKAATDKKYVGQSNNIARRLGEHIRSGKLKEDDLSTVESTEVLGGKLAREAAEQKRIDELGGIKELENKVNPIRPSRQHMMERVDDVMNVF